MIHVDGLTKFYGDYPAIQDVSFDVPTGQIVGFLGPNGAGKTTTMRILAGYLTASGGRATIDDIDVFWNPVEARRRIGYLPESCPLYPEMRVIEYLRFRGGIKGLGGTSRQQRIDYVMERCWLTEVRRQLIGTLSKGFRQRVGLADALLASPPVLIMDEPTVGLDPAQIRSTRALIRELGKEHTILLSTHILSEVEMTCDQVIIIHRGRVAAAGGLKELAQQGGEQGVLVLRARGQVDATAVRGLPGVLDVTQTQDDGVISLRITSGDADGLAPSLFTLVAQRGWGLMELRVERQTLEDLFVRITSVPVAEPASQAGSPPPAAAGVQEAIRPAKP
jgi:ABC-2 type transport system ATP-binding protein